MYEKLRNRRVAHLLMAPCGQRNDGLRGQSTFFRLKISTANRMSTAECGCGGRFQYCQQPKKDFSRLLLMQEKDFLRLFSEKYGHKKMMQHSHIIFSINQLFN